MRIHELFRETAADSFRQTAQSTGKVSSSTKSSKLKSFVKDIRQGYKKASDFQQELPHTKLGKAARGVGSFVKQIQKGPTR